MGPEVGPEVGPEAGIGVVQRSSVPSTAIMLPYDLESDGVVRGGEEGRGGRMMGWPFRLLTGD